MHTVEPHYLEIGYLNSPRYLVELNSLNFEYTLQSLTIGYLDLPLSEPLSVSLEGSR